MKKQPVTPNPGEQAASSVSGAATKPGTPASPPPLAEQIPRFETNVSPPDFASPNPEETWDQFFREHRPAPQLLSKWVSKLHQEKKYKQVIACLQAALSHGQAQPWMYEVLALNMEIEGYPKEDIERVVLSLTDFGDADFTSMMYSGAYLTRFGRKPAALTMYQQASRLLPERSEPYLLGFKLAKETKNAADIEWAAKGILENYWKADYAENHKAAELALKDQIQKARRENNAQLAEKLQASLNESKSSDLSIRLEWNGAADLDMQVEEPIGTVCSFSNPETQAGGIFLHDGVGPTAGNTYELYVCPKGAAGPYRITVKNSGGTLVGNRATLTVTIREGLPGQTRFVRSLVIENDEVALTIDLSKGRRTQRRVISSQPMEFSDPVGVSRLGVPARNREQQLSAARQEFEESRPQAPADRRAGAIGYAPVIDVISEGTGMSASATVSPDRRYIRIGIQPVFNDVTDVFTFTYLNGGNPGNR